MRAPTPPHERPGLECGDGCRQSSVLRRAVHAHSIRKRIILRLACGALLAAMVETATSELVEKSAGDISGGGPISRAISKRLRAYNKKIKRAEEIEGLKATGKEINEQQVPPAA